MVSTEYPHAHVVCTEYPHVHVVYTEYPHAHVVYTEYPHAHVLCTASQRTINNTFLYRNIQKNKQEVQYRLLLAFMKQKWSHQHYVLYYRAGKRYSFIIIIIIIIIISE